MTAATPASKYEFIGGDETGPNQAAGGAAFGGLTGNPSDNTALANALALKADQTAVTALQALSGNIPFNSQVGAVYQVVASDAGKRIGANSPTDSVLNLPDNATDPTIPIGFWCFVTSGAAGRPTLTPMGVGTLLMEVGASPVLPLNSLFMITKSSTNGWRAWRIGMNGDGVVVNDLITGGATSMLSAAQGVALQVGKLGTGTGAPAVVGQDVSTVRTDKPYVGRLYGESGGVVAVLDNAYTWETRPDPTTCQGAVITITTCNAGAITLNQDFFSNGTNWIPVGKRLTFLQDCNRPAGVVGTGVANQVIVTDTIPAGLVIAGCRVDFRALIDWTGPSTDAHMIQVANAGVAPVNLTAASGGGSMHFAKSIYVENATNLSRYFANSQSASDLSSTSNTAHVSDVASFNWTAAMAFDWRCATALPATSTIAIVARAWEIIYP